MRKDIIIPAIASVIAALFSGACTRASVGDRPKAAYDTATGRLQRIEFDANRNGRNDAVAIMDGTHLVRIELDLTENGRVDRWDFYTPDRALEKVGLSRFDDGIMDSVAFYTAQHTVSRIEISTHRDGTFNRVEYYVNGALDHSEEDTNGDGRVDHWETYRAAASSSSAPAYEVAAASFDDAGHGTPTRRFIYGSGGAIVRVETDPGGDGHWDVAPSVSTVQESK